MGVWMPSAILLVTMVVGLSAQTKGPEISVSRQMHHSISGSTCGQLICTALGNADTIDTVTFARVKHEGEVRVLLEISRDSFVSNMNVDGFYGNGTLEENEANIFIAQPKISSCDSDYFICNVTFVQESGLRQSTFAMVGPGNLPSFQLEKVVDTERPESVLEPGSTAPMRSPNILISELRFWSEKLTTVERKFQTLSDRLEEKITKTNDAVNGRAVSLENTVLQRVASVETDMSTRVSRLEDRLASLRLSQSPSTSEDFAESLDDLERNLAGLTAFVKSWNESESREQEKYLHDQPRSCDRGMGNDITKDYFPYAIMSHDQLEKEILCDTHTDGGGWIVIQRRTNGVVDFYQDWTSYRDGFGDINGDFWLGNEAIHKLTDSAPHELRVDMRHKGMDLFAEYSSFRLEDETNKYRLDLGTYTGNAGDGLKIHNKMAFSTFDRDSDTHATLNCAKHEHGAWWYQSCIHSNLNGKWGAKVTPGVSWYTGSAWTLPYYTEMKIRHVRSKANP